MNIYLKSLGGDEKKVAIAVLMLSFLYVLPFIMADLYYVDDLSRATTGYVGWGILGRPLSDSIMLTLSFSDFRLADVSPLPLILSAITLSFAICYCAKHETGKLTTSSCFLFSPLIINPFFLQNLSYKFDNLPMSVAVGLVAIAHIWSARSYIKWMIGSIGLFILSLCAYQTAANAFIGLISAGILLDAYYKKPVILNFIKRCFVFLASYAIYTFAVAPFYLETNRSQTISFNAEGITIAVNNINSAILQVHSILTPEVIKYLSPLIVICLMSLCFLCFAKAKAGFSLNNLMCLLLIVASPIIASLSIIGPLFILKGFGYIPRVMTGFTGAMVFIFSSFFIATESINKLNNKLGYIKLYMVVPLLFSFSLCYAYINAAKAQNNHDAQVIQSVFTSALNVVDFKNGMPVYILGETKFDDILKTNAFKFPIIASLYKRMYDWTAYMNLKSLGMPNMEFDFNREHSNKLVSDMCSSKPEYLLDNDVYSIAFDGAKYVIWLKSETGRMCK